MKKLITLVLSLSFVFTIVGGAYADTIIPTTDTQTTTTVTDPNTTTLPTDTTTTTTQTIDPVTTPPAIVVDTISYAGTIQAIDLVNKNITVLHANKKRSKVFTYDDQTAFVYRGKAISLDNINVGARLVVTYQVLSDNTEKVIKVHIVKMPKVKHNNGHHNKGQNNGKGNHGQMKNHGNQGHMNKGKGRNK